MNTMARTSAIRPESIDFGDDHTLRNWDLQALEANFDGWKRSARPHSKPGKRLSATRQKIYRDALNLVQGRAGTDEEEE
jgi:hypothetical protein